MAWWTPPPNRGNKHKGLERLRQQKQNCKIARRDLLKAGHANDSAPMLALKAVWTKLLKAHNKLRRAVKLKQHARAKKFAKGQFIKDRIKYSKNLFSGQKKSGSPTFSKTRVRSISANSIETRSDQPISPRWKA